MLKAFWTIPVEEALALIYAIQNELEDSSVLSITITAGSESFDVEGNHVSY